MIGSNDENIAASVSPYEYWEQEFDTGCLNNLRYVILRGFQGNKVDLDFAKFIISKARVLKELSIACGANWGRKWIKTQRRGLCLQNRASLDAQVVFVKD